MLVDRAQAPREPGRSGRIEYQADIHLHIRIKDIYKVDTTLPRGGHFGLPTAGAHGVAYMELEETLVKSNRIPLPVIPRSLTVQEAADTFLERDTALHRQIRKVWPNG